MAKKVVPKRTRIKRLKKKCDKALQDYYRSLMRNCESCFVKPANVAHHHVPQSRSNNLRYDDDNLILLCQGCHMMHHNGDPRISHNYRENKPRDWEEQLLEKQYVFKKYGEEELKEILTKYLVDV